MASSAITCLYFIIMLHGCIAVGENGKDPTVGLSGLPNNECVSCCSRIDNLSATLNRMSNASDKLARDVGEIKTRVSDDIPFQLVKQTAALLELKKAVATDIPAQIDKQSSELKLIKAAVDEVAIHLNNHSKELRIHDERLKEQGVLMEKLASLVKEMYGSLVGPKDCSDIRALGQTTSGVYRVYPGSLAKRIQADVYCDMTTPGGNWLVFQRRKDATENFERTWVEYLNGFGNPSGEFWLGNELLYLLTSNRRYKLRIDMEDLAGQKRYAEYSQFFISSSADRYRLTVSGYAGDPKLPAGFGESFSRHSGMQFSTKDADNDIYKEGSCSLLYRGGWWYDKCHASNLNGLYLNGSHTSYADGIEWYAFHNYYYSLKTTEMKIAVAN